jgi:chromosome segregation ATPase
MITRLYLDNMFKHFDQTFTFENGLTGVIGPNESGKSLIVEAIRYAL